MMRAENVESLYEATREWGLIDHNLVAGDVEGQHRLRVRAEGPPDARRRNGWLPVPGWNGEHEWDGVVDWSRMPRLYQSRRTALSSPPTIASPRMAKTISAPTRCRRIAPGACGAVWRL